MAQYSELITKIKADNSDFNKKIKDSENRAAAFSKSLLKFGAIAATAIGVTAVGGFIALLNVINDTTDEISTLVDTANRLGGSVAGFQKLQYAAKLSGVSSGELESGMTRLTKSFFDAQAGGERTSQAFQKLGLTTESLANMSVDERYLAVAQAFSKITDKTAQARIALELFGKSGLTQLSLIRDGVNGAFQDFDKFGGALTDEQAQAVDSYGDSVDRLKATFHVFATQLTATVAPAFESIINYIQQAIVDFGGLGQVGKATGIFLISGIIGAVKAFQTLLDLLKSIQISFLTTKVNALELYKTLNESKFAAFGGDLDLNISGDIAQLRKQIDQSRSSSNDYTSGLVKGLENARSAVANAGGTQKVEVTVKPAPQFEVEIAQSNAVSSAIRMVVSTVTAKEAQATIASGG